MIRENIWTMRENLLIGDKYKEASDFLSKLDSDWKNLIKKNGPCNIKISFRLEPYQSLIKSVIFQQLHPRAGNAIFNRFLILFNNKFPDAESILRTPPLRIKSCGLSQNKLSTIIEIASLRFNKTIPNTSELNKISDSEIIRLLTKIKGIGEWTVQMLLIFHLGRIDILPQNDLAIRKNYRKFKKLDNLITPKEIIEISKKWKPYRSVASWYLWSID